MTYVSPEITYLESIRDWMATLETWQDWTGLPEGAALKARVAWPSRAAASADGLPVAILSIGNSTTKNLTGAAAGANFQPDGIFKMWVFAADTSDDTETSYSDFADRLFQLKAEMADKAYEGGVLFNEISVSDESIFHSSDVLEESDDSSAYWFGMITIRWGVEA
jgi:hypothetical protein